MANTIQIKRSAANVAPGAAALGKGELAWVDHGTGGAAGILYIGDMTVAGAATRAIGGPGWTATIFASPAFTGVPTAPTAAVGNDTTQVATTAYVQGELTSNANPISQSSDTNIVNPAAAHVLIYDGVDTWDNKALSGDMVVNASGVVSVTGVAADSVVLGTDTTGGYVATITGTANEVDVVTTGVEGSSVQIGMPDNVTITGNLTVNGTQTTVDSTTVSVADPIFSIGDGGSNTAKDRGIEIKYNDGASKVGFFGMDDTDQTFKYFVDATNTAEVFTGTLGDAAFGNIAGTLTTAAQPNITSIGTIASGVWNGTAVGSTYGGTGQDSSGWTGIATITGGTWGTATEMPVTLGGTGLQTVGANSILVGDGANDMTVLAAGSNGQFLSVVAGAPAWSDSFDGGTF